MEKIAVIYWSGTGNTQAMAGAVAEGIQAAQAQADVYTVSQITAAQASGYSKLALGCPAMGAEVLEEAEFEPFFTELEATLAGKKVALFGSYGWGDGQWMRDWQERTAATGAQLYGEGLLANEMPDETALNACRALGTGLATLS